MRIKQKELIGKIPQVIYTKDLPNKSTIIIQVFDNPKCVNLIKKVSNTIVERQCYPVTDDEYQRYINSNNSYSTHSQVDEVIATYTRNTSNRETLLEKLRRLIWR